MRSSPGPNWHFACREVPCSEWQFHQHWVWTRQQSMSLPRGDVADHGLCALDVVRVFRRVFRRGEAAERAFRRAQQHWGASPLRSAAVAENAAPPWGAFPLTGWPRCRSDRRCVENPAAGADAGLRCLSVERALFLWVARAAAREDQTHADRQGRLAAVRSSAIHGERGSLAKNWLVLRLCPFCFPGPPLAKLRSALPPWFSNGDSPLHRRVIRDRSQGPPLGSNASALFFEQEKERAQAPHRPLPRA